MVNFCLGRNSSSVPPSSGESAWVGVLSGSARVPVAWCSAGVFGECGRCVAVGSAWLAGFDVCWYGVALHNIPHYSHVE